MEDTENQLASAQAVENSMEKLLKNWERRQTWHSLFSLTGSDEGRNSWRARLSELLQSTGAHVFVVVLMLTDLILTIISLSLSSSTRKTEREGVLYWAGIVILGVLVIKDMILMVSLGFMSFFRHLGYVTEIITIAVALLLEIFVETESAGLLVAVNSWRVVKVVQNVFELSDEAMEVQIDNIQAQFEALKFQNNQLEEQVLERDQIITELENEIKNSKIR